MTATGDGRTGRSTGHPARGWKRGRAAAVVVITGLTVAGLGGSSGASTPTKPAGLSCEQLDAVYTDTFVTGYPEDGSGFFGKRAGARAANLEKAARKVSDKRLKKALLGLASVFDDLADADNVTEAAQVSVRRARSYGRALQTFQVTLDACGDEVPPGEA